MATLTVYWPIGLVVFSAECDLIEKKEASVKFVKRLETIKEFKRCNDATEAEKFCITLMQGEMQDACIASCTY